MRFGIEGRDKQGPIRLEIEVENPFEGGGRWVRGPLHSHVAQMGPAQDVCDHYRGLGLTLLASTDYLSITPLPDATESFVTIPGAELFCPGESNLVHIIGLGLSELPRPLDGTPGDVPRIVRDVDDQGGIAVLAHPAWSDFTWEELQELARSGVVGFEISNRLAWQINGKERSEELWQMLLNAGTRLAAIGVDDATTLGDAAVTGRTWTGVLVRRDGPEGVLEGIRAHRTYASEGPILEGVRFEPRGAIVVTCSPCVACHVQSRGYGVRSVQAGPGSERFEVDLKVDGYRVRDWVSVCLEDGNGRRAWSSAIPVRVGITRID